jgi:hypothetical protein
MTRGWTHFLALLALLALFLGAGLASSGCTLLWLFNNDPERLPCEFAPGAQPVAEAGACLEGYTCVKEGDEFVCLKAGAKVEGEACTETAECDEDLVCATFYGVACEEDPDDANCSLIDDEEKDLACRKACDVNDPQSCAANQLCFDVEGVQFCQTGVCKDDTQCQVVDGAEGFCVGEIVLGGTTGFCFERCDPLQCADGVCDDCDGVDGQPDPGVNCVPVLDDVQLSDRAMCELAGEVAAFGSCANGARCSIGSFCANTGNDPLYCAPWCLVGGGAPACPNGADKCVQIAGDLGFCLP